MNPMFKYIYAVEVGDQERPIMVSVLADSRKEADDRLPRAVEMATGDDKPYTAIIRAFEEM